MVPSVTTNRLSCWSSTPCPLKSPLKGAAPPCCAATSRLGKNMQERRPAPANGAYAIGSQVSEAAHLSTPHLSSPTTGRRPAARRTLGRAHLGGKRAICPSDSLLVALQHGSGLGNSSIVRSNRRTCATSPITQRAREQDGTGRLTEFFGPGGSPSESLPSTCGGGRPMPKKHLSRR